MRRIMATKALAQQSAYHGLFGTLSLEGAGVGVASPRLCVLTDHSSGTAEHLIPRAHALASTAAVAPPDKEVESASSPCRADIPECYHQVKAAALNPQRSRLPLTACLPGSAELLSPCLRFITCSFKELTHRDYNFLFCHRTASFIK